MPQQGASGQQQPPKLHQLHHFVPPRVEGDAMHLQRVGFNHPPLQALHHHRVGQNTCPRNSLGPNCIGCITPHRITMWL
jgi:hypothetical protein